MILFAILLLPTTLAYQYEEPLLYGSFPEGFLWGTATAAYQVEGGANEGGKGKNIWDTFTSQPGNIDDGSSGEVACDSYHKYAEDVALMKGMGLNSYRFSIAWTRILPEGTGQRNPEGIAYYNAVLDELEAAGIEPAVTLYHWDLPQALQDQGGWLNSSSADWFEEYARVCFEEFGDRVKIWITLNEPWVVAVLGHGTGEHAPGDVGIGTLVYQAAHNELRAHGKAVAIYRSEFAEQNGKIGITLSISWKEPEDPSNADHLQASDDALMFDIGWFAQPILASDYPPVMREKIDTKSAAQGFPESRLPTFTEEELSMISGSADFLGINLYTSSLVYPEDLGTDEVSYFTDSDVVSYQDANWYGSGSSWLKVTPWGIRSLVNWVAKTYGEVPLYITENGTSDRLGNTDDLARIYVYKHYINQLLRAVLEDGVNLQGYFAWSLLDNFEWARGYTEKFGLHSVNMSDPGRARTAKQSSVYYSQIVANNGFIEGVGPCSGNY